MPSRLRASILLCLLGPWLTSGCRQSRPGIRNLLLISIDTLRADHVGSYGFARPTTPSIDALAREGALFKNVYSPVPVTLPAHCSMLTGTLPPTHGVRDNLHKRLPDSSLTLAEILKARGFATAAVVSSFVLDRRFNMNQGFDSYDDRFQAVHKIGDVAERKGDETTRVAVQWLDGQRREPFFLFVHYYDPHDDYEPPEPFASQWADDKYSGEVAFADSGVGRLLDKLKQLGSYDSTLVIVTGDHGEMLGEHGELNHGYFIYESALRVPLVIRVPGGKAAGRSIDRPVSLVDIVPTVTSLLRVDAPPQVQGLDLSPWLTGAGGPAARRALYAETVTPTRYYGTTSLLGVIADGWKYIETARPELYDLRHDPLEANDLASKETTRAEALGRELKTILAGASQSGRPGESAGLDEEARRRLESLGYLSRGGGVTEIVFDRSKEDPKDLIGFFRQDQRLSRLVEEKKYEEARVLCDEMLQKRPGFADCHLQMSKVALAKGDPKAAFVAAERAVKLEPANEPAQLHLAGLLRARGDTQGAIRHYRQALEAHPDSLEARSLLGRALTETGRFDEAVSTLGPALEAWPDSAEATVQMGFALARQGRLEEAIERYRRALAVDPASAEAHAYLGSALASQGKLDEAIVHFEQALRTRPNHAELHDWLGAALREKGRIEEALGHFREAVRLQPSLAVAHLNLGRALKQQGKTDEAVSELRRALAIDPSLVAAHNSLGSLLGAQGRAGEAVGHFREALRLAPADAEAHHNLGLALRMLGRTGEAIPHFRKALAARGDWPAPMGELAWTLATHADPKLRDPAEALRLAARAAELTSRQDPAILDALAAAYAATGDWEHATATATSAIALAQARSRAMADEIGQRLALYRSRQPYREGSAADGVKRR